MSNPTTGITSTPTIFGKVDYGPTFGNIWRPLNTKRIVKAAGVITILPFDVFVIVAQTTPAAFTVILPDINLWMTQPYGGFDLTIKNGNIGFDGTVTPFGAQLIDGLSSFTIGNTQNVGSTTLSPLNDLSGWISL